MPYNEHLREEWAALGYCGHCASAVIVPPPPEKFRRVYHLMPAEYALSNIVFSRIKVAQFHDMNDPFELVGFRVRGLSAMVQTQRQREELRTLSGILCFSQDWLDPVLWSHYGDKFRGVALGFDIFRSSAIQVKYTDERAIVDKAIALERTREKVKQRLLSTKFKSWEYEREFRLSLDLKSQCVPESGMHFKRFDEEVRLREVVLGPECSLPFRATRDLVTKHHPGVITVTGTMAKKYFSIVPVADTVPEIKSTKPFSKKNFNCPCSVCVKKRKSNSEPAA
jgi:hypothetical protein